MKRTILTLILSLSVVICLAKSKTVEALRFTYELCDTNSTIRLGYPDRLCLEIMPDGSSRFYSEYDEAMRAALRNAYTTNAIATAGNIIAGKKGNSSRIMKNYPKSGQLTFLNNIAMSNFYYTEEMMSEEVWMLIDETREVCGYLCKKAEADYLGRHWIAWYAEELPMNNGPWKLGGLPGLILEANDSDIFFHFTCVGIEKAEVEPLPKKIDKKYVKCKHEEYQRQVRLYNSDRLAYFSNQMAAEGQYFKVMNKDGSEKKHTAAVKAIYIEKLDGDEK